MATKLEPGTVIQSPDGFEYVVGFDQARPRWDSAFISSTQSGEVIFFKTEQGEKLKGANNGSVTADEFYTSDPDNGKMDLDKMYTVMGASIDCYADAGYTIVKEVLKKGLAKIFAGSAVPAWKGHPQDLPQGGGLDGSSVVTTREWVRNGAADPRAIRRFAMPIQIGPGSNYYGMVDFKTAVALGAVADTMLRMKLWGVSSTGAGPQG